MFVNYILKCWMIKLKMIYIYIYSLGKTQLQEIMYGEVNGGIKLTEEEKKGKIKSYKKHFGVLLKDIMNLII